MLIASDDMIVDMRSSKNLYPILSQSFVRGRKLDISLSFITQSLFSDSKKYLTKLNTLFCYENFKQTRPSKNCIYSIIKY